MNLLLALALLGQDINETCLKYDGDKPTACELSLAEKLFTTNQALEGCAILYEVETKKNKALLDILASQPKKEDEWSLFGMPGWVTPVAGALAVGLGVFVGVSFF